MTSRLGRAFSFVAAVLLAACSSANPASSSECGDGVKSGGEQCDDGNTVGGDGCSATCRDEEGPAETCGDGALDAGEACDDGNQAEDDGCTNCRVDEGFTCTGEPSVCTPDEPTPPQGSCAAPIAIDLVADSSGALVGHAIGDTTTGTSQVAAAECNGEELGAGNDLVYSFTLTETSDVDIFGPDPAAFDLALRVALQPCDADMQVPDFFGDGCDNSDPEALFFTALPPGTYYLIVDGKDAAAKGAFDVEISTYPTFCGDGELDLLEYCDDGDTASGDGCSANCTIESGYQCDESEPSVCELDGCGDGDLDTGETCDDGDAMAGDGCSATCTVETGYVCTGEPSVCTNLPPAGCGDGTFVATEECDDGANVNGDGCSSHCKLEYEVLEVENNNTTPQAFAFSLDPTRLSANVRIKGSFPTDADVDLYQFTLTKPSYVFLETYNAIDSNFTNYVGAGALTRIDCYNNLDTFLGLFTAGSNYASDTASLYNDDDDGDVDCSYIGTDDLGGNANQGLLQPGTYVIKLQTYAASPLYILDFFVLQAFVPEEAGDLVINEVLGNPNTVADSNCDGSGHTFEDEMIELVNRSGFFLDLTGTKIVDLVATRHTFAAGTTGRMGLLPGESIVVWGGGAPACAGVTNWFKASAGSLQLNNTDEEVTIQGPLGDEIAKVTWAASPQGESLNLSPDVTGTAYVNHSTVTGAAPRKFSPGKKVDNTSFIP